MKLRIVLFCTTALFTAGFVRALGSSGVNSAKASFTSEYKILKAQYREKAAGEAHLALHAFGAELYNRLGVDGVAICDSAYFFGCYHGIFDKAIAKEGIGILPELDRACVQTYGIQPQSCQHGIGHGILEFFGKKRLADALEACATLSWKQPLFGCASGIFMEYNFPIRIDGTEATMEPITLEVENPYEPCPALPEKFQLACYYEKGQWWEKVYAWDYSTIGRLCLELTDVKEQEVCFRGIGNVIAPSSEYDPTEIKKRCKFMPNETGVFLCVSEAAASVRSNSQIVRHDDLCGDFIGDKRKSCQEGL